MIITDQLIKPMPPTSAVPNADSIPSKRAIYAAEQSRLISIGEKLKKYNRVLLPVYRSLMPVMYACTRAEAERKIADFATQTKAHSIIFEFKKIDEEADRTCLDFLFQQFKTVLDDLYQRQCINGLQYSFFMTLRCHARPDQVDFIPDIYKVIAIWICLRRRYHFIRFLLFF